ncbi:hypothetical protein WI40_13885 [Burkholderia ubonensis]|uniref:DUF3383 domain-containing protein n=1 Tax=Burkholderia ubonensis TaxID=101571 RepID=A0A102K8J5_9BURK|nr:DUF3383 domain-containing protein [Burkholderia ubonensis]KUZ70672.1 hypothetical protein WI35_15435 [Burkholderia ubonensis]KUZ80976.1 hypothetical protein WI38_32900 [Burkholderia ubonensis]KUZ87435.1 hypothetical protein WI39_24535 [Burkholderia ubonensis]KUZ98091.1 hypothetical protein WI40_13885 [Burkholderia ubonensis]
MLPIDDVVNVQLNMQARAPSRRNFGMTLLLTPEAGNVFNDTSTLYIYAAQQPDVEAAFGTNSETARATRRFMAQQPRPKELMIGRWVRNERVLPATAAALIGSPVTAPVSDFHAVSAGYVTVTFGDTPTQLGPLNLTNAVTFDDVVKAINAAAGEDPAWTCSFDETGNRFAFTATEPGAGPAFHYVTDDGQAGVYLGEMMKLENGQARLVSGADAVKLPAESVIEAAAAIQDRQPGWYALAVAAQLPDGVLQEVSDWTQAAPRKIFGVTTTNPQHVEFAAGNVFKRLYDKSNYRTVATYDKTDPYAILSFLARGLSVNFAANNSTLTMKFKTLPTVEADNLGLTEANKCRRLGLNFYTYFDEVAMVAEGTVLGGRFFDEIHILDWFVDAVQKEVFAKLHRSPTKIPLTDLGTPQVIAAVERACREGLRNGAFAPGVWNGDPFGTLETGDYLDEGFYVWCDTVDNLSTSDREKRKMPPIQTAVKLGGAVHGVDVIINFDR